MHKTVIDISVRELIHLVFRGGDLDARFVGKQRALEGTKAHQVVQKRMGDHYSPEVTIKHIFEEDNLQINISGRIDGVIHEKTKIIDEIKSTLRPLETIEEDDYPMHWLQGELYAYFYAKAYDLNEITLQLTYVTIDDYATKHFQRTYNLETLEGIFLHVMSLYLEFAHRIDDWNQIRNESLQDLAFPFSTYRNGQRELAVCAYKTIKEGKKAFIQAPTGIGKTISTIFPTLKAMAEDHCSKMFYLTAKTITRSVAEEAFEIMRAKGLKLKTVTLTAKDKICFEKGAACIPEECSFAKGHYNRVNDAIKDILDHEDNLNRIHIEHYAQKYHVCPFEFALDLSLSADCIICDYNYVFDPRVNLKRFFQDVKGKYAFLIDESHNLVDRARGMYSAEITKKPLLEMKRHLKGKQDDVLDNFVKVITKYNKALIDYRKQCEATETYVFDEAPKELYQIMRRFVEKADVILNDYKHLVCYDDILDYYFATLNFLNIFELFDEHYKTYVTNEQGDLHIHLFCVDPAHLIEETLKLGAGTLFFSATLSPMSYFHRMYAHKDEDYTLLLPSPFDEHHRRYMVARDVMTTYKKRAFSYENVARYLLSFAQSKMGNYIVFFSSYAYKKAVLEIFESFESDVEILDQKRDLSEEEKEAFLNAFQKRESNSMIGFCVLGGSFSEGVDLRGDRLIGTAIVGVGLPMVCLEREIIKSYHEAHDEDAFSYAYVYPGLNKVMQAAGRVIRTEEDKGVILLMDERYGYYTYQEVMPSDWQPYYTTYSDFKSAIEETWKMIHD
ncbi:MAG: ATP-dependent DNA helicase [Clostridia bacterium]|nr:ATP-dependent DNA helicase [Clostridia bacterium]